MTTRPAYDRYIGFAAVVLIVGGAFACADVPLAPDAPLFGTNPEYPCADDCGEPEQGGDGSSGTSDLIAYKYGDYYHPEGPHATDADVDYFRLAFFDEDSTAFLANSRDWNNPDDPGVLGYPGAVLAAQYAAVAAVHGVHAARRLAATPQVRQAVQEGYRWARNVTAGVAAALLSRGMEWPQYADPDDIPVEEFDFMFDYATQ
jgi:hypothetical protein